MTETWLAIVGIGEGGLADLAPRARALVDAAEIVAGGARHLAMLPADDRPRLLWRNPLSDSIADILARRGQRVCVLATGDPMDYGIGVTLARAVPAAERTIIPAPSAFSLVCARLGWPRAEVETLTLHGRPLDLLHRYLVPGVRLLILSEDGGTPARVAERLTARGFGSSEMWVFEHLDGEAERVVTGRAEGWREDPGADLNTIAVACVADGGAPLLPPLPGLPDDAFDHDGQLTKRAVRAATLAALAPLPGRLLWDVGAGCGSVAIEWMRAAHGARALAVERDAARRALIAGNAAALGVPDLAIVAGEAPGVLDGLDAPDAVFIGGGIAADGAEIFEICWRALPSGGRLVANVVTVEGEAALARWHAENGGSLTRIAVTRAEPMGRLTGWRPLRAVTQFAVVKP